MKSQFTLGVIIQMFLSDGDDKEKDYRVLCWWDINKGDTPHHVEKESGGGGVGGLGVCLWNSTPISRSVHWEENNKLCRGEVVIKDLRIIK